jgi:hypothetical protein
MTLYEFDFLGFFPGYVFFLYLPDVGPKKKDLACAISAVVTWGTNAEEETRRTENCEGEMAMRK